MAFIDVIDDAGADGCTINNSVTFLSPLESNSGYVAARTSVAPAPPRSQISTGIWYTLVSDGHKGLSLVVFDKRKMSDAACPRATSSGWIAKNMRAVRPDLKKGVREKSSKFGGIEKVDN